MERNKERKGHAFAIAGLRRDHIVYWRIIVSIVMGVATLLTQHNNASDIYVMEGSDGPSIYAEMRVVILWPRLFTYKLLINAEEKLRTS